MARGQLGDSNSPNRDENKPIRFGDPCPLKWKQPHDNSMSSELFNQVDNFMNKTNPNFKKNYKQVQKNRGFSTTNVPSSFNRKALYMTTNSMAAGLNKTRHDRFSQPQIYS